MKVLSKKEVEILNKAIIIKINSIQKCNAKELAKLYDEAHADFNTAEVCEAFQKLEKRSDIKCYPDDDVNHRQLEKIGHWSELVGVYFVDSNKLKIGA